MLSLPQRGKMVPVSNELLVKSLADSAAEHLVGSQYAVDSSIQLFVVPFDVCKPDMVVLWRQRNSVFPHGNKRFFRGFRGRLLPRIRTTSDERFRFPFPSHLSVPFLYPAKPSFSGLYIRATCTILLPELLLVSPSGLLPTPLARTSMCRCRRSTAARRSPRRPKPALSSDRAL